MCDIDYFKNINDNYGHMIGDEVLKEVAFTIQRSLKRTTDLVARYGGEEFIIIMYDTDSTGAKLLCDEIADTLKNDMNYTYNDVTIEPFTISFGICSATPEKNLEYQQFIHAADEALYEAKERGRNCIVTRTL